MYFGPFLHGGGRVDQASKSIISLVVDDAVHHIQNQLTRSLSGGYEMTNGRCDAGSCVYKLVFKNGKGKKSKSAVCGRALLVKELDR